MTDLYKFSPAFEAQVVHHLCHNKGFATQFGPFMAAEMFTTEAGSIVWAAVHSVYKDLDDMPGCPEMIEQRIQSSVNAGKLRISDATDAISYIYDIDEPREVSYIAPELAALLRGYGTFKILDDLSKTAVQRKSLMPYIERIQQVEALGSQEVTTQDDWRFLDDDMFDWLNSSGRIRRLRTGATELDVFLDGGLPAQTLTTIVGASGAGKSFAMSSFMAAMMTAGIDCAYITLENPAQMTYARLLSPIIGIKHAEVLAYPDKARDALKDYRKKNPEMGLPVVRHYTANTAVETIHEDFKKMQKKTGFKPGAIFFDYLMLASTMKNQGGDAHRRYLMAGDVAKHLRAWADEDDLVSVTGAQASKKSTPGKRSRLTLDDIADSMNIARDSDIVLTVNIKEERIEGTEDVRKLSCFGVPKHRQGRSGDHTSDKVTAYAYGQVYPLDVFSHCEHDYASQAL
jgi:KaiC/GvpD/RAD55 family RecA-like ATPase